MEYWVWIIFGLALLGAETLAPSGYFLMFFGTGAVIVGLLVLLGIAPQVWVQWGLFSVISVALVVGLRKKLLTQTGGFKGAGDSDTPVGTSGRALENIATGDEGQVELRGANWRAKNVGPVSIAAGDKCTVSAVDGLLLHVMK